MIVLGIQSTRNEYKKVLNCLASIIVACGIDVFDRIAKELENAFMDFLISMNISVGTFLDTVAYSFLIPIITDIHHYIQNSGNPKETGMLIAQRLIASGVVVVGAEVLSVLMTKLVRRFK